MLNIQLHELLAAKEQRAAMRDELRRLYAAACVSISLNIPGPVKDSAAIRDLFRQAVDSFRNQAQTRGIAILEERLRYQPAGPFAAIAADAPPQTLKQLAVDLETGGEYGRLFDIDVFSADGAQLSRAALFLPERTCLLCRQPAVSCMREQAHSRAELLREVEKRLAAAAAAQSKPWPDSVWRIAAWAIEAMLLEVACTPSPGLVDRSNAGAHQDMDMVTFLQSSAALSPTMLRCAAAGWLHKGQAGELLPVLRHIGREGERDMFLATGGVNTQKGLVFVLGVLTAAAAMRLNRSGRLSEEAVFADCAAICAGLVDSELATLAARPANALTAGERLYLAHGITGIRGEMEQGLPSVRGSGLPALRQSLAVDMPLNDALVQTLLSLMTTVEDSTVLNRKGLPGLELMRNEAQAALALGGMLTPLGKARIEAMDALFSANRVSPGGVADLLAATYFIHVLLTRCV
ncbi:MAG: citrate lyase holo-[acyl-carrier protein] synthase [Sporomusaceae bacterium]|nr:citrate lyase holo-[acyl-carrier protein] synthase [Sporomusaceae bacterium]